MQEEKQVTIQDVIAKRKEHNRRVDTKLIMKAYQYADKFPGLTTPDASYHGITYTERFGKGAYITKATAQLMRDFGAIQSPQNAFYLNLGLETLHLRMQRHCENALAVARFLQEQEQVAWVHYAGLEGDKYHELAEKYMPSGTCGVLAFAVKGGRDASIAFMDKLVAALEAEKENVLPLFSGTQAAALPISLEASLKEYIFAHAPHLRNDARVNVYLTYHIQGGYYAYIENVERLGYDQVIDVIAEIQNTLNVMKTNN